MHACLINTIISPRRAFHVGEYIMVIQEKTQSIWDEIVDSAIQNIFVEPELKIDYKECSTDWMQLCRSGELSKYNYLVEEDVPLHIIRVHRIAGLELPKGPNFSVRVHIASAAFLGHNNYWWYQDPWPVDLRNAESFPQYRYVRERWGMRDRCLALRLPDGRDLTLRQYPPAFVIDNIRNDLGAIGRYFD